MVPVLSRGLEWCVRGNGSGGQGGRERRQRPGGIREWGLQRGHDCGGDPRRSLPSSLTTDPRSEAVSR